MAGTVFTPSLEGMKHVKSENGVILTKPFLDVCKLIMPVLGDWLFLVVYLCLIIIFTYNKFGAAMSIVKSDIGGNITVRNASVGLDDLKAS
ncbi:hypothetical protein BHM03_00019503 [Ensete ventricosum]|uniref:Uncharacterized protein n=1 Tax=Ensete ventricosum TaxID=4639 RepID=A0A427AET9_ENSVE|nr:hypothetical protein B296_00015359 [Ensete ventricosum]RZR91391.1 hypothetical protein BHM03_00019503 [Ensete ventricosum]